MRPILRGSCQALLHGALTRCLPCCSATASRHLSFLFQICKTERSLSSPFESLSNVRFNSLIALGFGRIAAPRPCSRARGERRVVSEGRRGKSIRLCRTVRCALAPSPHSARRWAPWRRVRGAARLKRRARLPHAIPMSRRRDGSPDSRAAKTRTPVENDSLLRHRRARIPRAYRCVLTPTAREHRSLGAMPNSHTVARDVPCIHGDSSYVVSDTETIRSWSKQHEVRCCTGRKRRSYEIA